MSSSRGPFLANKVLRAAEVWADANQAGTLEEWAEAEARLHHAVRAYREATRAEHVQGPDIDADAPDRPQ